MRLVAPLLVALLGGAPAQRVWIPARPVAQEAFARAELVAGDGPWLAAVRELPLPESLRLHHAPRAPWQLLRTRGEGEPELLIDAPAARGGWGAPNRIALAPDGTLTATWRPGHQVLVAPPGEPAAKRSVHDDGRLECVGLTPTALVLVDRESRALEVRALSHEGVGAPVALGAFEPRAPLAQTFGAPWLVWIDAGGSLLAVDVERGVRREVTLPEAGSLRLDGVWNGRLFAHRDFAEPDEPRVYLVELERGRVHALHAPSPVRACLPEGVFSDGWLWDPVDGRLVACEATPQGWGRPLVRRAPDRIWLRESGSWRELRLDQAPVPLPADAATSPEPAGPARAPDEPARAAWRAARGG